MPTYSYACTECDNRFDVVQAFTDQSLTVCPTCSGRLRKLFNAVGIVFKGSGFYRNDSREKTNAHAAKGEGNGSASSADSSDSKSSSDKPSSDKSSSDRSSEKGGGDKKNGSSDKPAAKPSSSSSSSAKSGAASS